MLDPQLVKYQHVCISARPDGSLSVCLGILTFQNVSFAAYQRIIMSMCQYVSISACHLFTYQINISSCQDINTPFCKFQNILLLQFQPAKRLPCHLVNEGEVSTSPFHVTVTLRIKIKHNFSGNSGLST